MIELGAILKEERIKKNISVDEVCDKLKIRKHILNALENGQDNVLPDVYLKAFLKKYAQFLQLPNEEIIKYLSYKGSNQKNGTDNNSEKVSHEKGKENNKTSPSKTSFSISTFDATQDTSDYAEIFKKKNLQKSNRNNSINYIIYTALFVAAIVAIYFTFFYDGRNESSNPNSTDKLANQNNIAVIGDTAVIGEKRSLFTKFAAPDSMVLTAIANDTAWLRVNMDNARSEELLMKPGMQKRWTAGEFFEINQGNAGAIEYRRNGEVLPPMANQGLIIRGVRILKDTVINKTISSSSSQKKAKPKKKREIKMIQPLPDINN